VPYQKCQNYFSYTEQDTAMVEILSPNTSKSHFFVIDSEDAPRVKAFDWVCIGNGRKHVYAFGRFTPGRPGGISMHYLIMGCPALLPGFVIDHIDGDTRNNKKSNLRIITQDENCQNRKKQSKSATSRYIGVYQIKNRRGIRSKWAANVFINKKRKWLGTFDSEGEALGARNEAIKNQPSSLFRIQQTLD
jgi:hypothetical protein